jgi:hypothetical protein
MSKCNCTKCEEDWTKLQKITWHLLEITELIGEEIPIVFMPRWADPERDPLKTKTCLIVRDEEFRTELENMYGFVIDSMKDIDEAEKQKKEGGLH